MIRFNFLTVSIIKAPLSFLRPHLGFRPQRNFEAFLGSTQKNHSMWKSTLRLKFYFSLRVYFLRSVVKAATLGVESNSRKVYVFLLVTDKSQITVKEGSILGFICTELLKWLKEKRKENQKEERHSYFCCSSVGNKSPRIFTQDWLNVTSFS